MRRISNAALLVAAVMGLVPLSAQTPIFMKAGYTNPTPIRVAPGQVITLYISGTKTVLPPQNPSIRATTTPLPITLGGFSVTVRQGNNTYPAPLFSVVQTPNCTDTTQSTPGCIITALTLQIPFEITPLPPVTEAAQLPGDLSVNDNGTESAHFPILPLTDNIHALTSCDSNNGPATNGNGSWVDVSTFYNPACTATVTHADGTLVTANSPAKPGETVVIYAYGLGQTTPAVKSGVPTPTPAPVLGPPMPFFMRTVGLIFDFRVNAGPTRPYVNPTVARPIGLPTPEFVGLTPGQVGLYQVNVKLPDTFPPVDPCTTVVVVTGNAGALPNVAISNLTISMGGVSSFDGAAICVQPPQ